MAIPFKIIELDRPYKLRFGMGAMMEFEQITGLKLTSLESDELDATIVGKILWVMLRQDDENLTEKDVYKLVDEYAPSLSYVLETVGDAIRIAFEVDSPNAPKPRGKK